MRFFTIPLPLLQSIHHRCCKESMHGPYPQQLPPISPYKEQIDRYRGCSGALVSESFGQHHKTDINSYLQLIVRKITEKCQSTQDLMNRIRMVKLSDHSYVTPGEFRVTLIKFGVTLPQEIVDQVFNVFDSDRSGTMDFDEFADWIMNSDTKPYVPPAKKGAAVEDTPAEALMKEVRHKIMVGVQKSPSIFARLKRKLSFLELISIVNTKKILLNERDVRFIFLHLDPNESGFIYSKEMIEWAKTGEIPTDESKHRPQPVHSALANAPPPIGPAVAIVTNRQPSLLHRCFKNIPKDQGVKMNFDEFRQCLLSGGLGLNKKDAKQLFFAIGGSIHPRGGEGRLGDVDILFAYINKFPESTEKTDPARKVREPFKISDLGSSVSLADRRLREAIRVQNCFKLVLAAVKQDADETFIDVNKLVKIINKFCCPITYNDFRLIAKDYYIDDRNRMEWPMFLHEYNPMKNARYVDNQAHPDEHGDCAVSQSPSCNGDTESLTPSAAVLKKSNSIPSLTVSTSQPQRQLKLQPPSSSQRPRTSARPGTETNPMMTELRKKWTIALRECQKYDQERKGDLNNFSIFIFDHPFILMTITLFVSLFFHIFHFLYVRAQAMLREKSSKMRWFLQKWARI